MAINNINLKNIILCSMLFFISFTAAAKQNDLSEQAQSVKTSFNLLKNDLSNIIAWESYLNSFPKTLSSFKKVFDPDDFSQLYNNSHEYIFIFENVPKPLEGKLSEIIVSVAKGGAKGCCDSWSALHSVAKKIIAKDTKAFVSLIKSLKPAERYNFIKFFADKENHRRFIQYQEIIDNLYNLKENDIAKEFETARKLRKKEKH